MLNHFQLLQLPTQFEIALPTLEAHFRRLQAEVHPDKYVNATPAEKLQSMQMATLVNEAFQTLKSPSQRAAYLLSLQEIDVNDPQQAALPADFLISQMDWRETMEDAKHGNDIAALETLLREVRDAGKAIEAQLTTVLASAPKEAVVSVKKLIFIEKVSADVNQLIASLED